MTFPDFDPVREYLFALIPLAISVGSVALGVTHWKRTPSLQSSQTRSARVILFGAVAGFCIGLVIFIAVLAETHAKVLDAGVFWRTRADDITSITVTVVQQRPEAAAAVVGAQVTLTDPSLIREFVRLAEQSRREHTDHNYFTGGGFRVTLFTRLPDARRLHMSFYNRDSRGAIVTVVAPELNESHTWSLGQYKCEALMRWLETLFIRPHSAPASSASQQGE